MLRREIIFTFLAIALLLALYGFLVLAVGHPPSDPGIAILPVVGLLAPN